MPTRLLLRCAILLLCFVSGAFAADDATTEQIRNRIQQMRTANARTLSVGDVALAAGVAQFYEQRSFAPAWSTDAYLDQLLTALADTVNDGLDPEDYHLSQLQTQRADATASAAQRADFDLLATDAYLRALIHLFRGKIDPTALDSQWNFEVQDIAPSEALPLVGAAVDRGTIAEIFAQARPQHPLYPRLRTALSQLRAIAADGGWPQLPTGPTLKPGVSDTRVILLRKRLQAAGDLPSDTAASEIYDEPLSAAVAQFQREQYLQPDGAIGPATLAALNISTQARIDQLRVNLERARWLLHDIPENFVLVDVAGYKISYYKNGQPIWRSRVQIGKPYRSTPIFKSKIDHITLNPTWTVPPTILRNDVLPKVRNDVNYLARNNIRVLNNRGQIIEPTQVNWRDPGNVTLRQDASPTSALGRAAIRFPNSYAVYLHDTPHQELFVQNQRAFSSGCIRVERALELVELLLADTESWGRAAIDEALAAGKTRNVSLASSVPILLAYWTVDVGESGHIAFKPDIYDRDGPLLKALNKPDRARSVRLKEMSIL